jgi:diguanylate cyclase (GGDEF)-like protein
MRKRIGIYGLSDEVVQLVPLLVTNPDVEIGGVCDPQPETARKRLARLEPALASGIEARLVDDPAALAADAGLYAVIDAGGEPGFAALHPEVAGRGVQVVTPLTARLLWGYGTPAGARKAELLQTLHEVVESYNLTIDADELFGRMLEIARGVTGAEGGSLMLLEPDGRELRVRVAVGVEPELWPKIRVRLGEGIAGRVAADARPLHLRGKADRQRFRIAHERLDVESALCVPLVHEGRVLGVLNLHHGSRPDAFSDEDLAFVEQLARLDAQIIARAQEHEALRSQASRFAAVREVRRIFSERSSFAERLERIAAYVAERAGGIATLYLWDPDAGDLRLAASSLSGGGFGAEYRLASGQGIDGGVALSREPAFLHGEGGAMAYAALPLLAGEALVGVLSIQAGPQAPRGRAAQEILLEMAAAAAEGIASAEREAAMETRATRLSAINETGIRMIQAADPAEVLRLGTSGAALVLEADHAILRLQDEQTGRYAIRSYFGSAEGREQEKLFRLDKRVSVETIKRRAPLLVRDLASDERLAGSDADVRSLCAAPLLREGRVIGTLALYDKVPADRFTTGHFSEGDLQLFAKFTSYLERAVAGALAWAEARQFRNFDSQTGLPNARYLAKRIDEEVARADGRDSALALTVCRLENLAEIEGSAGPGQGKRVFERTIQALRDHLRDFDVMGRTGDDELTVLLPEPGLSPGERVFALARAVAEEVTRDEALNQPRRVALAFGYAIYPSEGADREALLARAREPRIRMV